MEFNSFRVVRNEEDQYSIWPTEKELPSGWTATGIGGSKEVCLEFIDKHWTDMRPMSVRTGNKSPGEMNA